MGSMDDTGIKGLPPAADPLGIIATVVRETAPPEIAEELLERLGSALGHPELSDWDDLASEHARLEHELELVASTDRLTGLRNRPRFFEDLRREFAESRRHQDVFSVLALEVDGLRVVNEELGIEAGDELLVSVAEALLRGLRVSDIAARTGGDHFAVILPRTGRLGAEIVAERLVQCVGTKIDVGLASLAADVTSAADLLERAERDLDERKRRRRGQATAGVARSDG